MVAYKLGYMGLAVGCLSLALVLLLFVIDLVRRFVRAQEEQARAQARAADALKAVRDELAKRP